MKIAILINVCILLLVPCLAAENPSAQDQQRQNNPIGEIEKYISRMHRQIENYYDSQLSDLNQRAQLKIKLLEIADKANCGSASLAAQSEVAKALLRLNNYGYQEPWYSVFDAEQLQSRFVYEPFGSFRDDIRKSPKQFAAAQSQIIERKSRILAQLEWETLNLQRRREYALTDGLAQLEKQLKEEVSKPAPSPTPGLVTGILYSEDKPAAIIDHKIVHNGQQLNGVTIVKIEEDKVRFEKNGKKWEQKVQQKPESYWK